MLGRAAERLLTVWVSLWLSSLRAVRVVLFQQRVLDGNKHRADDGQLPGRRVGLGHRRLLRSVRLLQPVQRLCELQ